MSKDSDWIQTFTGRKVWPLRLTTRDICIEDIAAALSCEARFSGHCRNADGSSAFYSVAQHSVLVSLYCEPAVALWGLLHDASEAYLHDIPRPLKRHPDFAFYRTAEATATAAICEAFGLPHEMPPSVKEADTRLLATEARDLMSPLHPDWRQMAEPYKRTIRPLSPAGAAWMFHSRFNSILSDPVGARIDSERYEG